ncbi:MAG: DUF2752 domain-containing protein [Planctomycetota bacterium]
MREDPAAFEAGQEGPRADWPRAANGKAVPGRGAGPWPVLLAAGLLMLAALAWFDPADSPWSLCLFHRFTGLHCPGCGALRATHAMLHGRLLEALQLNSLWVTAGPVLACMVVARLLRSGRSGSAVPAVGNSWASAAWRGRWLWCGVGLLLVFAVLRNLPWYPWTLLAPPG